MAILKAQHLAKSYKSRQVVRDVSLSIESGQIVGLLGPNGAGKTTCFYMIVGLFFPKAHHLYGPIKVFSLFGSFNIIGFIIIYYTMIETKDKTEE